MLTRLLLLSFFVALSLTPHIADATYLNSNRGFDPSIERLPSRFDGHNILGIIAKLAKAQAKSKGEFERTEDYEARVERARNAILGAVATDIVAVVVSNRGVVMTNGYIGPNKQHDYAKALSFSYDADTSHGLVQVLGDHTCPSLKDEGEELIELSHISHDGDGYAATNAYGAETRVTGISHDVRGVAVSADAMQNHTTYSTFDIPIDTSAKVAREVKTNGRVLLIGKLRAPELRTCEKYYEPTLSNPNDVGYSFHFIDLDVHEMWLFDYLTGEVFVKQKVE